MIARVVRDNHIHPPSNSHNIGFWILLQLFSGVGSIAYTDETTDQGGVAYMAHVGGFFAGLALAYLMRGLGPSRTV